MPGAGSDSGANDHVSERPAETSQPTESMAQAAQPQQDWKPIVDQHRGANDPVHPAIAGDNPKRDACVDGTTGQPEIAKQINQTKEKEVSQTFKEVQVVSTLGADTYKADKTVETTTTTTTTTETKTEGPMVAAAKPDAAAAALLAGGDQGDANKGDQKDPNAQAGDLRNQALSGSADAATQQKALMAGVVGADELSKGKQGQDGQSGDGKPKEEVAQTEQKANDKLMDELSKRIGSEETAKLLVAMNDANAQEDPNQTKRRRQSVG
jgi:hypothetical protein